MDIREHTPQPNKLSEEFFHNIFTEAGDGIFLVNENALIIEANPRGCEILGYSRDELLGSPVLKFQPPDAVEHIMKKLAQLAVEKQVTTETVFLHKNGTRIPVEITGKLMSTGQIIGLLRDISERKNAERALVEREQMFHGLVEHSPDGIVMVDETGHIIEWNPGQEEITGLLRSEVIGKLVWDVQFQSLPEKLRTDAIYQNLKEGSLEIQRSGRGPGLNQPSEKILYLANGTSRTVEIMTYSYQTHLGYRVGSITRDISKRKQIEMLLEYMATHDALTDLPNRQLLQDRLESALQRMRREQRGMLAIMMLDLDNFKVINDTCGHACGDQLLKVVAHRLQGCMRKSDTVARMSGDEFAFIIEEITDLESSKLVAQKILDTVAQEVEVEGRSYQVTASIGVSLYSFSSNDITTLLREADMAMYRAKRTRNCFQFYNIS